MADLSFAPIADVAVEAPRKAKAARAATGSRSARLKHWLDRLTFNTRTRAAFYRAIAEYADAGVTEATVIEDRITVARRRFSQHSKAKVYVAMRSALDEGKELPDALAPWIPAPEAAALAGAAAAGQDVLHKIIAELGNLLERQAAARHKLASTVGGGAVGLAVAFGVIALVVVTLLPVFHQEITPALAAKVPFAATYFAICGWLVGHAVEWVPAGIAWIIATIVIMPLWTGRVRGFYDQYIPPFSLYQRVQATLFLSTTAAMTRAGVTLSNALTTMRRFGSRWLRSHLDTMQDALAVEGAGEVEALAYGPLPHDTQDALLTYAHMPRFQDALSRLAEANFAAYEAAIARLSVLIRSLMAFLMTGFGGATVIAMFQFSSAIRAGAEAARHAAGT